VKPFTSLAGATAHYAGLYRTDSTTVLAVTLLEEAQAGEMQLRAGILAGSGDLLLAPASGEQPYFNQLASFPAPGLLAAPWG